jgi:23S rRNA (cytosine1962-C5)-methyltransferase
VSTTAGCSISSEPDVITLVLKRGTERRARGGHPWIFSNEVATSLRNQPPGELCEVVDHGGRLVGHGYFSAGSLICTRLLSRDGSLPEGADWFGARLEEALARRRHLRREAHRLVHSEADELGGLVIDRYGDAFSVQCLTQGMEQRRAEILSALRQLFDPALVLLDGSSPFRELEQLPRERSFFVRGEHTLLPLPAEAPAEATRRRVELDGLRFELDFREVQKGGLFLDQAENWPRAAVFAPGRAVLDICCYHGGWGLAAGRAGATSLDFVDSSAEALERVALNLELNGLAQLPGERLKGDAFAVLKTLAGQGRRYGLVILDPPAFIKGRKGYENGRQGYIDLNRQALALVEDGGVLATCSCSHHLGSDGFREVLRLAAKRAGRRIRILGQLAQGSDHPILPAMLETAYLKGLLLLVEPA